MKKIAFVVGIALIGLNPVAGYAQGKPSNIRPRQPVADPSKRDSRAVQDKTATPANPITTNRARMTEQKSEVEKSIDKIVEKAQGKPSEAIIEALKSKGQKPETDIVREYVTRLSVEVEAAAQGKNTYLGKEGRELTFATLELISKAESSQDANALASVTNLVRDSIESGYTKGLFDLVREAVSNKSPSETMKDAVERALNKVAAIKPEGKDRWTLEDLMKCLKGKA